MTPTAYVLSLFLFMAHLASAPESRAEEAGKAQNDVNANKLENGGNSEGYSLSIDVKQSNDGKKEKDYLDVGQAIELLVTIANVSPDKLTFEESNFEVEYRLAVLDSEGKSVPRTLYDKSIQERNHTVGYVLTIVLSPGKSRQYKFNLSRRCDLSLTGTYSVQVSRKVLKKDRSAFADLKSNVLSFELR